MKIRQWLAGAVAMTVCVATNAVAESEHPECRQELQGADAADTAGRKAFAEGRYQDAAQAFECALQLDPGDASFAANLGETYRRLGDCPRALKNFGRFLSATSGPALQAEFAEQRSELNQRAAALRAECGDEAPGGAPRLESAADETTKPPAAPRRPEAEVATPAEATLLKAQPPPENRRSKRWAVGLEAGATFGRWASARSTSPAVRATGTRLWQWDRWGLGAGAGVMWSTFAYDSVESFPSAYSTHAQAVEAVAEAQVRLLMTDWLTLRADAGGGLTWFSGFDAGNELADEGRTAAAGARPTVRAALAAEIDLPVEGLVVRVTPASGTYTSGVDGAGGKLDLSVTAGVGFRL